MKMYCECRVSGEYGLNIVLSFLEGYGFSAGGQFAFRIMSDDGELGAILENKDEVIREIINNNHINIIIINNDFDSLFFSANKISNIIKITFSFDGWTVEDAAIISSSLFSRLVTDMYRQVDGEFFNAYFE